MSRRVRRAQLLFGWRTILPLALVVVAQPLFSCNANDPFDYLEPESDNDSGTGQISARALGSDNVELTEGDRTLRSQSDDSALYSDHGLMDPKRLRVDYDAPLSSWMSPSELVSEHTIERATVPCADPDDVSCRFRDACGSAPLNPLTGDSKKAAAGYVVNGEDAKRGEWPSFVLLEMRAPPTGLKMQCGGALISDRHVLTAAHCVFAPNSSQLIEAPQIEARLGKHSLSTRSKERQEDAVKAKSICVSNNYKRRGTLDIASHDWALVELRRPVTFTDHIQPACLPFEPIERRGKPAKCWLVGGGMLGHPPERLNFMPRVLQKLRVEQVSCKAWGIHDRDRSRECYSKARRQKGDSCDGDSGSPVLCLDARGRWTVAAAVSSGTKDCDGAGYQAWIGIYLRLRTTLADIKADCNF